MNFIVNWINKGARHSSPGPCCRGQWMRVLVDFNASTLDDVGPVGGDKGEKFLSELNEMQDLKRDAGKENPDR